MSEYENDTCIECESRHLTRERVIERRDDNYEIFEIIHHMKCENCSKLFIITEEIKDYEQIPVHTY